MTTVFSTRPIVLAWLHIRSGHESDFVEVLRQFSASRGLSFKLDVEPEDATAYVFRMMSKDILISGECDIISQTGRYGKSLYHLYVDRNLFSRPAGPPGGSDEQSARNLVNDLGTAVSPVAVLEIRLQ